MFHWRAEEEDDAHCHRVESHHYRRCFAPTPGEHTAERSPPDWCNEHAHYGNHRKRSTVNPERQVGTVSHPRAAESEYPKHAAVPDAKPYPLSVVRHRT